MEKERNENLWRIAKLRVKFKQSAIAYVLVNTLLVVIWYFSGGPHSFFWPAFSIFFWGIGLASEYHRAYVDQGDSVKREYEKMIQKNQTLNF
ncbi:2TM domain-containing protein [Persicitalea sp.]|uniref:2TM domain-containing protein n=1 Tax=Persicitalea sp. TaxID=3100273 RepID=UPI0035943CC3